MAAPILFFFFFLAEPASEEAEGPAPSLTSPNGATGAGGTGAVGADLVGATAQGRCLDCGLSMASVVPTLAGLGPGVELEQGA